MSAHDLTSLIAFAHELADLARAETLPRFRRGLAVDIKEAAEWDPVTEADREAERVIRAHIEEHHPGHGIIGEEWGTVRENAPWRWVLDPVDGTRAFVCGTGTWTTLIALEHHGEPVVGVIDQAFSGERWVGTPEGSTWTRGDETRALRVRTTTSVASARITSTDPVKKGFFEPAEAAAFDVLAQRARVGRWSLDAYGYGLLASGDLDLVVEASLQHYDYAALVPVVRGAGGLITGWKGEPVHASPRGRVVAAATKELHMEALETLRHVD